MVLRKPYAFLIKYFKLIHLGLLFLVSFILYKTYDLSLFYKEYIGDNFSTNEVMFADKYFNGYLILGFVILIGLLITIFLLMQFKKKSVWYYVSGVLFYGIVFIVFFFISGNLMQLERSSVESATVLIYRDVVNIIYYPQFIFVFLTFLKGIGFDIKTFSFNPEFDDFELDEEDNEEVEVSIKLDNYKVNRQIRRTGRELKYYVLENKFVFSIILIGVLLFIAVSIFMNFQVYNKTYNERSTLTYDSFNLEFKDSFITQYDYKGDLISNGNYYLAVIVNAKNISLENAKIDSDAFKIEIDGANVVPRLDLSGKFADIAIPYYGVSLLPDVSNDYVFVYELGNTYKSNYTISILDDYDVVDNEIVTKYKHIKINPSALNVSDSSGEYELGEKVVLNENVLLDTYIQVDDYVFRDKHNYVYEFCYLEECSESKGIVIANSNLMINSTLMILDVDFLIDDDSYYYINDHEDNFFDDYVMIQYVHDDEVIVDRVINVTPDVLDDKLILQVSNKAVESSNVELLVKVRGVTHTIVLKK